MGMSDLAVHVGNGGRGKARHAVQDGEDGSRWRIPLCWQSRILGRRWARVEDHFLKAASNALAEVSSSGLAPVCEISAWAVA
jgi:hypothetical protein